MTQIAPAAEPNTRDPEQHADEPLEVIKVSRMTKFALARPCTAMWAILSLVIALTFVTVFIEVRDASGFLDVL